MRKQKNQNTCIDQSFFNGLLVFTALFFFLFPSTSGITQDETITSNQEQTLRRAIKKVQAYQLKEKQDTPWVALHALIAFEQEPKVLLRNGNEHMPVVDYLLNRATYEGKRLVYEKNGVPQVRTKTPDQDPFLVQDHVDQLLMALADADVALDRTFQTASGNTFSVQDLLHASKNSYTPNQEIAWTLVAYTRYLSFDQTWTNRNGQTFQIKDVLQEAIERNPSNETEGGPHHLYGIAYAINRYKRTQNGNVNGPWKEAENYVQRYVRKAKKFQQEDGQFSVRMFKSPARSAPNARYLVWATGHTLEWLTEALPSEELRTQWIKQAALKLAETINNTKRSNLSDGGMYHAAHALRKYIQKID